MRRALGFEKWNVWGISYGLILGQAYVKEDPDGILAVVIDAIMPLDIRESELYWRIAHWYDRDLQKLQEICLRQPSCAKRYPDIGGRLRAAVQSVVDNPIEVDVKDIENFPSGKARIFQDLVAFLPFIFFYEQDNYPGLPGLIYAWADAVERRDETLFKAIAAAAGGGGFGDGSQGMSNAIFCMDGDEEAQARAGKIDILEHPVLGAAIGSAESYDRGVALCLEMGMPQRPAEEYSAVQTSLLNKFYDNPGAEPDLSCVDKMEEPQIWAPMFTTGIAPRLMLMLIEDKKTLAIPAAWAGSSILIALIAFLHLTLSPVGRKIDDRQAVDTGSARGFAWLAALLSLVAVSILGAAVAVTADTSELLLIAGLVPWAQFGAWGGLLAGVVGLITIGATIQAQRRASLPVGTLLGLLLTGIAAASLSAFLIYWDLGPF